MPRDRFRQLSRMRSKRHWYEYVVRCVMAVQQGNAPIMVVTSFHDGSLCWLRLYGAIIVTVAAIKKIDLLLAFFYSLSQVMVCAVSAIPLSTLIPWYTLVTNVIMEV